MIKKLQKSDYLFVIALIAGFILHMLCIFSADHFTDESFYVAAPLRLINGDSLVQHEWHVTQFSSLFLYIPVRIWMALNGSTEGIILFLRFLYLAIHTLASVGIYSYFRKKRFWAVIASLFFYMQVPVRYLSLNYNTIVALCLLIMTIILLETYKKANNSLYVLMGICYGCCCVCNPFFCFLFGAYFIFCIVYKSFSKKAQKNALSEKNENTNAKTLQKMQKVELYGRFFGKQSLSYISLGVIIVAVTSIVFFYATGGTILSLLGNLENLLTDSQHSLTGGPLALLINKIKTTIFTFNEISFNLPFLLPCLYISLLFDKNRKKPKHILFYLISSLALAILNVLGITHFIGSVTSYTSTLPFAIISSVCYILTENKNRKLFYCMWLPGVIATIVQYFATGVDLTVCWVLIISNIAGVFFVKDLFAELQLINTIQKKTNAINSYKTLSVVCKGILCIGLCLQLCFQCYMYSFGKIIDVKNDIPIDKGPYAGFYLKDKYYDNYISGLSDMDIIKERSEPDDPVLIVSQFNWLYLYIERPIAGYSAWGDFLDIARLRHYYGNNLDKKPKYIYISYQYIFTDIHVDLIGDYKRFDSYTQRQLNELNDMFDCTQEELSSGILLTVNE